MRPTPAEEPLALQPDQFREMCRLLVVAYRRGDLDRDDLVAVARILVAGDLHGRLWSLGLESGMFYRLERGRWTRDEPAGPLLLGNMSRGGRDRADPGA